MSEDLDNLEIDAVDDRTAMAARRKIARQQMEHHRCQDILDDQRAATRIAANRGKLIKLGLWVGK